MDFLELRDASAPKKRSHQAYRLVNYDKEMKTNLILHIFPGLRNSSSRRDFVVVKYWNLFRIAFKRETQQLF